jgi:hypothetical protein
VLARQYERENAPSIAALSMSNPRSPAGLGLFSGWNALLTAMGVLAWIAFGRRLHRYLEAPRTGASAAGYATGGAPT